VTPKEFNKYLERDFNRCVHCGKSDDTLIPQHRSNRGMGSVKSRNRPSNIVVLCSAYNGLIESNAQEARRARNNGWKLSSHQDSLFEPLWDAVDRSWWLLDDDYGRVPLMGYEIADGE
jgi:hypothetical protein